MSGVTTTTPLAGGTLNPQILEALLLVDSVRREVQALLPQALITGRVTVSESQIRQWENSLQTAARLVQRVPVILIFPPPPFARFANAAVAQIDRALETLRSIPIASPAIFPPQPGQAVIPLQDHLFLLNALQRVQAFLLLALQAS